MTKKLMYLLGIIITILVGTYFFMKCCSCCGLPTTNTNSVNSTNEEVKTPVEPEATSYPFSLKGNGFEFSNNDNFNFKSSEFKYQEPLSENVNKGVTALQQYLDKDATNAVTITGYYTGTEENNSAYPNLGIARANAIKNYVVASGVPSSKLNIAGQLIDSMVPKDNIYYGPVAYEPIIAEDNTAQMDALYLKIKANPLVLHFKTGEAAINLTTEQRQKIADISTYLDKVEGAMCTVVGHTDNTGIRTNNINLGLNRANFAKQYLIGNGISSAKINTSSKGPDEPIATNDTEEGKAQNRRTVVTLK